MRSARQLAARKSELEGEEGDDSDDMPATRRQKERSQVGRLMRGTR